MACTHGADWAWPVTVPVHYDDYTLFKSPLPVFRKAADQAGLTSVIHYLNRGDSYRLGPPEQ